MSCKHIQIRSETVIQRDGGTTIARLRLTCASCRMAFQFMGMASGISSNSPMTSADRLEARLPVVPAQSSEKEIRCSECDRILFGPGLQREHRIRNIQCGTEHVIRWADNRVVAVNNGAVRVLSEGENSAENTS
jgi:Tfp pilus assembly protein FimT